jgi:hypothetical protein
MPEIAPCLQAARAVRAAPSTVNPLAIAIEVLPPAPRAPDPPPPPDVVPPQSHTAGPTQAWSSLDAYWWATLCRANSLEDDSFLRRTLSAKADYARYTRFSNPAAQTVLKSWYASFSDRVYIGIGGTDTEAQALEYCFSHAYGQQLFLNGWWNSTFAVQAQIQINQLRPLLSQEGAIRALCLIGHSYGAAVCPAIAAGLGFSPWGAWDRLVAFAQPRCYTQSGRDFLAGMQLLTFTNLGDPVFLLPPPRGLIQTLPGLATSGSYPGGDYSHAGTILALGTGQGVVPGQDPSLGPVEWLETMTGFLTLGANLEPHFARAYVARCEAWLNAETPANYTDYRDVGAIRAVNQDLADAGV